METVVAYLFAIIACVAILEIRLMRKAAWANADAVYLDVVTVVFASWDEIDRIAQKVANKHANGREIGYAFWDLRPQEDGDVCIHVEYSKDYWCKDNPFTGKPQRIPNGRWSALLSEYGIKTLRVEQPMIWDSMVLLLRQSTPWGCVYLSAAPNHYNYQPGYSYANL
jgi:hypothetical protein